jgi:ferredoxin
MIKTKAVVAVLGSGPNGVLAAKVLLSEGFVVHLFDIGRTKKLNDPNLILNPLGLKMVSGSIYPYDINEYTILNPKAGDMHMLIPSCSFGGFSTVWGGAITDPPDSQDLVMKPLNLKVTTRNELHSNKRFKSEIKLRETSKVIKGAPLVAIDKNLCNLCGKCLIGCPQNAIWSATETFLEICSHPDFHYFRDSFVTKIENLSSGVQLHFQNTITKISLKSREFEAVFLAAGVVGTSALLLKSKLLEEIKLRETQIGFLPFIKFRTSSIFKQLGALSEAWKYLDGENNIHFQIYCDTKYALSAKLAKYPRFISQGILAAWKVLSLWVGIAIIYIAEESSHSASLTLDPNNDQSVMVKIDLNAENSRSWRKAIKVLSNSTYRRQLLTHRVLLQVGKFGASNHVRGELTPEQTLKLDYRIILVDSLANQSLTPGPVTVNVMTESQKRIIEWVDRFKVRY